MLSTNYIILTILGCAIVTWLSRVLPFVLLKKFDLPKPVIDYQTIKPTLLQSVQN